MQMGQGKCALPCQLLRQVDHVREARKWVNIGVMSNTGHGLDLEIDFRRVRVIKRLDSGKEVLHHILHWGAGSEGVRAGMCILALLASQLLVSFMCTCTVFTDVRLRRE